MPSQVELPGLAAAGVKEAARQAGRSSTVVYIGTSLDGFIARPDGAIDWMGEPPAEGEEDCGWAEFHASIDAIVMGRGTFEKVLTFGTWPYGVTPVTVLSSTLRSIPPHLGDKAELSSEAPRALLQRLASRGRKRVYVDGGRTIQGFMRAGLIDELIVTTIPVLIGQGIPLFGPLDGDLRWEHVSTRTYTEGLVKSHYRQSGPRLGDSRA